eukprot:GHVT01067302.1.p2 GENE.GHVT01067302.1~~GHVT01067302.1.p2  ORF type:complete len:133 (+),score=10.65 GHVT01067302.1:437-835(+)
MLTPQPEPDLIPSTDSGPLSAATPVGFDLRACNSVSLKNQEIVPHFFQNPRQSFTAPIDDATDCCAFLPKQAMNRVFWMMGVIIGVGVTVLIVLFAFFLSGLRPLEPVLWALITYVVLLLPPFLFATAKINK